MGGRRRSDAAPVSSVPRASARASARAPVTAFNAAMPWIFGPGGVIHHRPIQIYVIEYIKQSMAFHRPATCLPDFGFYLLLSEGTLSAAEARQCRPHLLVRQVQVA